MLSASPKAYHTITTYPRRYDVRIDTVSDRIRFYRLEAGLTQLQLAAEIGKSRDTILNVEKEPDLVTLETCNVCALACGVDPATLYDDRLAFLSDAPARIRDIRKNHQLTQDGLAKKIGVSRTTIKMWEHGQVYPQLSYLRKLLSME